MREVFDKGQRQLLEESFRTAIMDSFADRMIMIPAHLLAELLRKNLELLILMHTDAARIKEQNNIKYGGKII